MKILTKEQIYAADERTIKSQGTTSYDLMERVAKACSLWLLRKNPKKSSYDIFVGKGNNGGDGLAIARLLHNKLMDVNVHIIEFKTEASPDFKKNLKQLTRHNVNVHYIRKRKDLPKIGDKSIIIDAIFGIGVYKPVKGIAERVIEFINEQQNCVISIDVPSGLNIDGPEDQGAVVVADTTLSLTAPKLNFLTGTQGKYTQSIQTIDIDLDVDDVSDSYVYQSKEDCKKLYRKRRRFTHKGSYGHSLVIGGSYGKMGSIILTSRAALKSGSGLVTCYIPSCGYNILQSTLLEAMCETDKGERTIHDMDIQVDADVIAIGPGLGQNSMTKRAFANFIEDNDKKLVIDADALNLLAQDKSLFQYIPKGSILTPHVKEFERLVGTWTSEEEKLNKIRALAEEHEVIIVFKDAISVIAGADTPLYFNSSGNPGLATAGSGDVLTGVITALLAQGYSSLDAARLGAFIHGRAGDIYIETHSVESLVATSIIENLGKAFLELHSCPTLQFNSY